MRPDATRYLDFYSSPLGAVVPHLIANQVRAVCPVTPGAHVVGLGYALPLLDILAADTPHALALMPAQQGAVSWPQHGPRRSALVFEHRLPLRDETVDHMILLHMLEHASNPHRLLREIWRVLAPGGHLVIAVPNRRRMWSALDVSPFGYGRPYSRAQLEALLQDHVMTPLSCRTALLLPPLIRPWGARLSAFVEDPMIRLLPDMGGVLVISARKDVEGTVPGKPVSVAARAPVAAGSSDRPSSRTRR